MKGLSIDLAILVAEVAQAGFGQPASEHRFHPHREWRFDLAWPDRKVAFEREGLAPGGQAGRHNRIGGFVKDIEKYNAAQILGWCVIRGTGRQIESGLAVRQLIEALTARRTEQ
jgi:hypothetical protein